MAWYCPNCYGDGIVLATPRAGENAGITYAFRCGCLVGQAKPQTGIPLYSGSASQHYEVIQLRKVAPAPVAEPIPAPLEPADSLW